MIIKRGYIGDKKATIGIDSSKLCSECVNTLVSGLPKGITEYSCSICRYSVKSR